MSPALPTHMCETVEHDIWKKGPAGKHASLFAADAQVQDLPLDLAVEERDKKVKGEGRRLHERPALALQGC